ncbi:MAG: hypothetical protein JWR16_776 [Nevskia sp.]|nr:hypothetical protein [Nevskia sp.]
MSCPQPKPETAIALYFESTLAASPAQVWQWITSWQGICRETMPWFRMTAPPQLRNLGDLQFQPGVPLLRSIVLLFGFIPIDRSDLTLLELEPGAGFVEQSPMASMQLWRHERRIVAHPSQPAKVLLIDRLRFEPRRARRLVAWFVRTVFQHRHEVLRAHFNVR